MAFVALIRFKKTETSSLGVNSAMLQAPGSAKFGFENQYFP